MGYAIALEHHEDGYPHIHAYVELSRPNYFRNMSQLDLGQYHGNYQPARGNREEVLEYLSKEDHDPLQDFTRAQVVRESGADLAREKRIEVAKSILEKGVSDCILDGTIHFTSIRPAQEWFYLHRTTVEIRAREHLEPFGDLRF